MKENAFQGWVIDVAERNGWRVWHVPMPVRPIGNNRFVPDSRGAGLPDLILLHPDPPRLIFAELKGDGGKLSDRQREFLRLARAVAEIAFSQETQPLRHVLRAPIGVYSWRPGLEPHIETILRSKVVTPS